MYVQNKLAYIPTSQLDTNDNIDFETSSSTSTTTQPVPVVEECVLPVRDSPEEKKEKKALRHHRYEVRPKKSNKAA